MTSLPTVLIIDNDREAAAELTRLLDGEGLARVVATASSVAAATGGLFLRDRPIIDCLFIRIHEWDEFLRHREEFSASPLTVVFLSGRDEKCTRHLAGEVDFHLQPPYKLSRLTAIFKRRLSPGFEPRPLDFFFLKVLCRYHVIRFDDILEVRVHGKLLTVRLTAEEYTVSGSLTNFNTACGCLPNGSAAGYSLFTMAKPSARFFFVRRDGIQGFGHLPQLRTPAPDPQATREPQPAGSPARTRNGNL